MGRLAPYSTLRPAHRARPSLVLALSLIATVGLGCSPGAVDAPGSLDRIVIVPPDDAVLVIGEQVTLSAVAVDAGDREIVGRTRAITWESSAPEVASVEDSTGVVTAIAAGHAVITARVDDKSADVAFDVTSGIAALDVTLSTDSVRVADEVTATATITPDGDAEVPAPTVVWSSLDPTIVTLSAETGASVGVRGAKVGTTSVIAQSRDRADTVPVRVIARVGRVVIDDKPGQVTAGDCVTLSVRATAAGGTVLNRVITYESADPTVATVDAAGRACWEAVGSTTIVAESEGVEDGFTVEVRPVPVTVVGIARDAQDVGHGFMWTEAGGMQPVTALPGLRNVTATGVNANGQIVGTGRDLSGLDRAFVYTRGRGVRELPPVPGATEATVRSINNLGQAVGASTFPDRRSHAVVWVVAGDEIEVLDLGTLLGGTFADATSINNKGTIVGTVRPPGGGPLRGYRMSSAADPPRLIDEFPGMRGVEVYAINESGFVVGAYEDAAGRDHPFLYDGTSVVDLGIPPGCEGGTAYGISTSGRIAVTGERCEGGRNTSFHTNTTGGSYNRLSPEPHTEVRAMSPEGLIAGFSLLGGRNQAVMWRRATEAATVLGFFPGEKSAAAYGITSPP
jgi:probable HAF family extracellular repeat protein